MALTFIPVDHFRTKFYQKEKNSKGFAELTEEQLADLAKKVYKKQEINSNSFTHGIRLYDKLERYQSTLQYLTNPHIHLEYKTFDERLAYLIMMVDPNLVTFKEYLKLDLTSLDEISKIEDEKERIRQNLIREQTLIDYETKVRDQIGFFDLKLLKHEEAFFRRFYGEKELITEIGTNNQDKFISKAKILPNLNSVSDERYEELVDVAQGWLSLVEEKHNSKVATYSVTKQSKLLGLNNLAEQLTLFILLVDSELDMLKIYEEESMMDNVEKRTIEQFGFFNKDLLTLEKKFHERFCPEKKLSPWTKNKKMLED